MIDEDVERLMDEIATLRSQRRELHAQLDATEHVLRTVRAERDRLYLSVNRLVDQAAKRLEEMLELRQTIAELSTASHELHA